MGHIYSQTDYWDQGLPDEDRLLGGTLATTQTELLSSVRLCLGALVGALGRENMK